jgi:hypothetical protein
MSNSLVTEAIDKTLIDISPKVHNILMSSNWPEDIVNKIRLVDKSEKIELEIPEEIKEQVHDLEYGTSETSPSYTLRKIREIIDESLAKNMAYKMSEVLSKSVFK